MLKFFISFGVVSLIVNTISLLLAIYNKNMFLMSLAIACIVFIVICFAVLFIKGII